ncbi:Tcp1 [Phodopus roborovskii]|uniref:Tcp1 protein n=1 Tax=Phodopus roborovskii TaxID=109678 RepID=A0AAV0A7P1_PHORO|nr:Tcp1 [Phodopus roborovskii]
MEGPLSVFGDRSTGEAIRSQNVMAAASIANIVKSSLGPVGLDKMLVDDIGDVTITNDGATILKLLEVEHPAAKVLCELADLQDKEVGDGTTSVVRRCSRWEISRCLRSHSLPKLIVAALYNLNRKPF